MKKILAVAGIGAALAAGALVGPGTASAADTFTMCPTQHQGVIGDHTSCVFAENVQRAFYASGRSSEVIAYSPVTGERYVMSCVGGYTAHFAGGGSAVAFRCDGGDDASVVIW
jgi:hypothetical protein